MEIKIESPIVKIIKKNEHYELDYKQIKRGTNTQIDFDFYDTHFLNYTKSCSCTEPTITYKEGYFTVTVGYDSNKIGTINQFVIINTTDGGVKIDVKGQVI